MHWAAFPCLMPRDATENIASPVLSTHTPDLFPPSHDGIRNFSTISDPATRQCPASFPNILIHIPDTKDFCPAGLSGFLAQIFKGTSLHDMSIPSTSFLTRTISSRERSCPCSLLGWGPPGLFLQCFNLCVAAQPVKFSGAPGR